MALIHAKQKENETHQLTADSRDYMETTTTKWTKVANDVANSRFSAHYRGPLGCKDKWQVLFLDYKKINDYRSGTGHNEDYFRMHSRRRKELTLPTNFCQIHFKEMELFLHQRPSMNPPHQRDNFGENDHVFDSATHHGEDGAENDVEVADEEDDDFKVDPVLQHSLAALAPSGLASSRLPPKAPKPLPATAQRGKERLENATKNMSTDPRPPNTAVKRRHNSSHSKMLKVTESQGKEIVSTMKKLGDMEDKKVAAAGDIAQKQLEYFKIRDSEIAANQRGLMQAVNSLSSTIVAACADRSRPPVPHRPLHGDADHGTAVYGSELHGPPIHVPTTAMHKEHQQEDYGLEFERIQDCNHFNVEGAQSANIAGAHVSLKEASIYYRAIYDASRNIR
jgi:hypothetical protein